MLMSYCVTVWMNEISERLWKFEGGCNIFKKSLKIECLVVIVDV